MDVEALKGKRIGILGFGIEGRAVATYLDSHGIADVAVFDRNAEILGAPKNFYGGPGYLERIGERDVLFRSPGISPDLPEIQRAVTGGAALTSQIKFFLQNCGAQVIGVTGTKGKGTTCSLVHKMLGASGKTSHLAGNIGAGVLPLLDVATPDDYVVLELSSFQLQDVDVSPHVAVVLMVTSAHLDYHGTQESYVAAKENITRFQTSKDFSVTNVDFPNSVRIGSLGHAQRRYVQTVPREQAGDAAPFTVYRPEDFLKIKDGIFAEQVNGGVYRVERGNALRIAGAQEFALRGFHNLQNVAAALAVSDILNLDSEKSLRVAKPFTGLPHRLELVGEVGSVRCYDDSIGTTPDSAAAAIGAFDEPVVAIMGGHDNGNVYTEMAARLAHQKNLKGVVLIGEVAEKIEGAMKAHGLPASVIVKKGAASMDEAVAQALALAERGDVLVLAPGAQSFGMFKNYQDRGDQFRNAVANRQ